MGDVIAGRFELLDVIASGASGTVWRAADLRHGRVCAAKVMRQRDSVDIVRFARENSVRIDHPTLLAPYAFVVEDDYVVIGMPLLRGGTLDQLLKECGPLPEPLTARLLAQLLDALVALHASGWVHRDVKPGNILLAATGPAAPELGLADFGIAVHEEHSRLTATGFVNGTPGFVPPEIESGGLPSPQQDLWAAGVVAVRCLRPELRVSRLGSGGAEVQDLLRRIHPALARAIGTLLEPEPSRRGPSAAAVLDPLGPVAATAAAPFFTREGTEILVPDRMNALPVSSRWRDTDELHPGDPELTTTPVLGAPRSRPAAPVDASPTADAPTHEASSPRRRGPRRRGLVPTTLGAVGLLAAVILTVLTVLGPPAGDQGTADPGVTVGALCGAAEENQSAIASSGAPVLCTRTDEGAYRWLRA